MARSPAGNPKVWAGGGGNPKACGRRGISMNASSERDALEVPRSWNRFRSDAWSLFGNGVWRLRRGSWSRFGSGSWSRFGSGSWIRSGWFLDSIWEWFLDSIWMVLGFEVQLVPVPPGTTSETFYLNSQVCWFRWFLVPGFALVILARRTQAGNQDAGGLI